MGEILWLASYPKSGNTWIRILLANYLSDADAPADINELGGGPIASTRAWFDELVGIEASALDEIVVERLRPEVYRCLAQEADGTFHMKVHDAWGRTDLGTPLFPPDVTAGVVYIIRNPLDLAASCAHHWGTDVGEAVAILCDAAFSHGRGGGFREQLRQRLGSWSEHVRSWVDDSELPVHLLRYEDMRRDPEGVFAKVALFYGLPLDRSRVRKAVAFSSFAELRRQEQERGFRERPRAEHGPFFRRGVAGAWREELPPGLVDRLIEAHGETMRRFGYLDGAGRP